MTRPVQEIEIEDAAVEVRDVRRRAERAGQKEIALLLTEAEGLLLEAMDLTEDEDEARRGEGDRDWVRENAREAVRIAGQEAEESNLRAQAAEGALRDAEAALVRAREALDLDRTGLAAALNRVLDELRGRYWMRHEADGGEAGSWGSYRYEEHTIATLRRDIGWAFEQPPGPAASVQEGEERCECGHLRSDHSGPDSVGTCWHRDAEDRLSCPCERFVARPSHRGGGRDE